MPDDPYAYEKPDPRSRCLKYLAQAEEALAAGQYKNAHNFGIRARMANNSERRKYTDRVDSFFNDLGSAADTLLSKADGFADNTPAEAYLLYDGIGDAFSSIDQGKSAKLKVAGLRNRLGNADDGQLLFKKILDTIKAEWLVTHPGAAGKQKVDATAVIAGMQGERRANTLRNLKLLLRFYGRTPAGQKAMTLAQKLQAAGVALDRDIQPLGFDVAAR